MNVFGLVFSQGGEFGIECLQVESGNLLVEVFGELVDLVGVFLVLSVAPKFKLSQNLVSEGVGHDE